MTLVDVACSDGRWRHRIQPAYDVAVSVPYIAVIGAAGADADAVRAAEAVGRGLAEHGAVLICGGLGGVMEAACMGARAGGGLCVGILPGSDRNSGNSHLNVAIATGMGELRNGLVIRAADAAIAIAGSYGTLSEIALALHAGIRVVGLGTWELARRGEPDVAILQARDPEHAVQLALEGAALARPLASVDRSPTS